jgi:predicted metal-dependent hydrolase
MQRNNPTPPDLTITPRSPSYGQDAMVGRWWWRGDPVGTALYNAFSVSFPPGERFFVEALKALRLEPSERQRGEMAAFVAQESMHAREHVAFNAHVARSGYDVEAADARTRTLIGYANQAPIYRRLAVAVALEHFTAILANAVLSEDRYLAGAPADIQRLWRWHAIEEIEHKAVLFDAFIAVTARVGRISRWLLRTVVMAVITSVFVRLIGRNIGDFLGQDGRRDGASWRRLAGLLLINPGIATRVLPAYLAYYAPGFHPWRRDDRPLVRAAESALSGPAGA